MKIVIEQSELEAALKTAASCVDKHKNPSMAVLGCVRLVATANDELQVMATDLLASTMETVKDVAVERPGSVAVSASVLLPMVRSLAGKIAICGLDNDWIGVNAGRTNFKVMGMSGADYPVLPVPNDNAHRTVLDAKVLADIIDHVEYAISPDEARVNLHGMLLETSRGKVSAVATDGHRLTRYVRDCPTGLDVGSGLILHARMVKEMSRMLRGGGEVTLTIDPAVDGVSRFVFLEKDSLRVATRTVYAVFPPYQQVIPPKFERVLRFDRDEMITALNRMLVLAPERTACVALHVDRDELVFEATNPDIGTARQAVAIALDGEPIVAGFNARYLVDALSRTPAGEVEIRMNGELDSLVVTADGYTAVVMPMRI